MSVHGIDLKGLSLQDALDLAILIEEEARERYEEFSDQMEAHRTPEAGAFFRFMAANEEKHRVALEAQRTERFGQTPRRVARGMLYDVEAPDYDQARAFMSPRQAMLAALRSEQKAHGFFVAALGYVRDPEVRDLFEELRGEEVQHQQMVLQELEKLPPDPGADPEAFVDEPQAL
jgi:erythrin-vacuolar iron transport family protein